MASRGIRDRFRAQMRQEVKQMALRQLAEGGPAALSLNAIAKELGVSGPALYRYFAGRDALLTELILDAYADLAAALEAAPPRLFELAAAYRAWAVGEPHRYRLLFAAPLPGYDAHDDRLVAAAHRAMTRVIEVAGPGPEPEPALARQLAAWSAATGPAVALRAVTAWSRLHGLVSLEIEGNFRSMGLDPGLLFDAEMRELDRMISN
ncbi:TetR family transcriptional regulator [Actinoplanes sp. NBRC 14428]|uniref:TetR family transcriptional regulator n=1 Tax=Pseudosporangium ferrugineum TaxID=439699 RepID=A0A2T0S803_9ACTN|nr:TetR/AcrR family transcriptional regulator [Pseudosporangium ferrugineum]PRY29546.1 TetR family transcriptional regulator [Pseudosporangium ferrugineum]BCJ52686.1 TetR family transcriptional regulator [Actinoplanes sp. NBRC 14428]